MLFRSVAWQGTAELICTHFAKGKEIIVEGRLSSRDYEDKTGNKRSVVELTADKVHFCGSKDAVQKPTQTFTEISEDDGGDLPF